MSEFIGLKKSIAYAKKCPPGYTVDWFARQTENGYEINTSIYYLCNAWVPDPAKTSGDGWVNITSEMYDHISRIYACEDRIPSLTERVKAACEEVFE